jgi:plastocyanin
MNPNNIGGNQNEFATMTRCGDPKRRIFCATIIAVSLFAGEHVGLATTFNVDVGASGSLMYTPSFVAIQPGDTVKWTWKGSDHSVTSGTPGQATGLFDSGIKNSGFTFSFTFPNSGTFNYFCTPHGSCCGMIGTVMVGAEITPTPTPTPTPRPPSQAQLLNISTRMDVQTGDNVLIGGFIVTGNVAKKVVLRAIGPSLAQFGIVGALADPVLELHQSIAGIDTVIASNDNWIDSPEKAAIEAAGFGPQDDLESAIIATLDPNAPYTAIVSGKNGTSGVGLVEAYDLDQAADAQLANISTRGFVETGNNVMIGGFILGNGTGTTNVVIRGLGPSLSAVGVAGALTDPTLELHDANGAIIQSNDNWKDNSAADQAELTADQLAPTNDLESALIVTIPTGAFTAILAGQNGATGVGLVEAYRLP